MSAFWGRACAAKIAAGFLLALVPRPHLRGARS